MKKSPSIDDTLKSSGLKNTAFRRELLQTLIDAKAPLSSAQIYALLRKNKNLKGDKFDRATLFRNLKTLVEKSALNTTEFGTGAAFYCLSSEKHHHHHVYCMKCETVAPIAACAAGPLIQEAESLGYKVLNHRLELIGLCPECHTSS